MVTCSVVKSCDGEAVLQGVVECTGCDAANAEYDAQISRRHAEADLWEQRATEVEAWLNEMDPPPPAFIREQYLNDYRTQAQTARATADGLAKLQAKDRKKHTHPVTACAKHVGKVS